MSESEIPFVKRHNEQVSAAKKKAEAELQKRVQNGEKVKADGLPVWERFVARLCKFARELEKMEDANLSGSASPSDDGAERSCFVQVRCDAPVLPALSLVLRYKPGDHRIRWVCEGRPMNDIELVVGGFRDTEIRLRFDKRGALSPEDVADQLIEWMIPRAKEHGIEYVG